MMKCIYELYINNNVEIQDHSHVLLLIFQLGQTLHAQILVH